MNYKLFINRVLYRNENEQTTAIFNNMKLTFSVIQFL